MIDKSGPATLRIEGLEFDPAARIVVVGERRTPLDRRSCSVLLALAERLGEHVGKDELLRVAWPTQLVHENSLAKAISKLRRAIDGSGLEITVAYGVGYSLRRARHFSSDVGQSSQTGRRSLRVGHSRYYVPLAIAIGGLLLTATAASLAWMHAEEDDGIRNRPPITYDAPGSVATILWVDDNPSNNEPEVAAFRKERLAVHLAVSTEDALKLLSMNSYRLVVSDLGRGEDRLAGLKMIEEMKRRGLSVPVLIYTVRPNDQEGQQAQRRLVTEAGASDLAVTPQEVRSKVLRRLLRPYSV